MKEIISQPVVYLQEAGNQCYVSFDLRVKGKKGTMTFNVPTEFKSIEELKNRYDTYIDDGNIRKMNLTQHAVANNQVPSPLLCYVFTMKHLVHYIKRNLRQGMSVTEAIYESLVLLTRAYFPKHIIEHKYNEAYAPFGKSITNINIHNSNVGTIILGNGNSIKVEIVGKYIDKYVCLNMSTTKYIKKPYTAVLCKLDNIAINSTVSTIPHYNEHHLGN